MTRAYVVSVLLAKEARELHISLADGSRYVIRGVEQWSAQEALILRHDGDMVHVAYRNIFSIRVVEMPGK